MGDLCTVGYERRTVDELITTLTRAAVEVLVDVRLTPLSRKPGLSKNHIATRLGAAGIDYLHLPQLGNPRDNRDGFRRGDDAAVAKYRDVLRTPDGQAALDQLLRLATRRRVAVMCFEREEAECHRSVVADALVEAGATLRILHL